MKSKLFTLIMALALFTGVKAQDVWFDANFGTQEWWDAIYDASVAQGVDPPLDMSTITPGNPLNFSTGTTFVLENVNGGFRINGNAYRDASPFTSVCGETFEYSIRLRNGGESFIEFPEFPNAGNVTVYAQNPNATNDSNLNLQKKNDAGDWVTIDAQVLPAMDLTPPNPQDYELVFTVNETGPVTLRLWRSEQRFFKIYRIVLDKNDNTSIQSTPGDKTDLFVSGKTLSLLGYVNNADLSVFNLAGTLVFNCKANSNTVDLQNINAGAYVAKLTMKEGEIIKKVIIQ